MTLKELVKAIIEDLNEQKTFGFIHVMESVGWGLDAVEVAEEVEKLAGYKGIVIDNSIYFKLV